MEESPVKENVLKNSELRQRSHLHHTPKLAQQKFGGKHRKFEMVADMLYLRLILLTRGFKQLSAA
jgi:hypothetical protein